MTEPVSDEDEALEIVAGKCQEWVESARELRRYTQQDSSPGGVLKDLREVVRPNLDKLEMLLDMAIMLRSGAVANARETREAAEDAWDDEAQKARRTMRGEYEGAQERYAWWRLATRDKLKVSRRAERMLEIARDAEERVRLAYYGLDKVRQDLNSQLRVEGSLERT